MRELNPQSPGCKPGALPIKLIALISLIKANFVISTLHEKTKSSFKFKTLTHYKRNN